jgi:hypothetical protein
MESFFFIVEAPFATGVEGAGSPMRVGTGMGIGTPS